MRITAFINTNFRDKGWRRAPSGPYVQAYTIEAPEMIEDSAAELAFVASNHPGREAIVRPHYNGPSLSVGDLVLVEDEGKATYLEVANMGFKPGNTDPRIHPKARGLFGPTVDHMGRVLAPGDTLPWEEILASSPSGRWSPLPAD